MVKFAKNRVRTRFAPSPTGFVHIGSLRTALYDYLIAKKYGGDFVLRIEDTDQKRLVEGSIRKIVEALNWAGIGPDEGVMLNEKKQVVQSGEFGPYIQSERLAIYQKYAQQLVAAGHAYYCFCTPERLDEIRKIQQTEGKIPGYDKHCATLSKGEIAEQIQAGTKYVIRMRVPENENIFFEDLVFGKVSFNSSSIDDQVLIKSDGFPTYHLAVVVDDHLMNITHITRGEEWLPSTPKHILLYKYFGWDVPQMIHFPNVLGQDKKKLSKRQGDVALEDFQQKGYLPEAIINFLAFLGWNPKSEREIFSLDELIEKFDPKTIHKAGAVFDYKKLDWMNAHYIRSKKDHELVALTASCFDKYFKGKGIETDPDLIKKIVKIEKERAKVLTDFVANIDFYFTGPDYDANLLRWKENSSQATRDALEKSKAALSEINENDFEIKKMEEVLFGIAGDKKGELLWPLRVALSGQKNSPSPFEIAWAIGKSKTLARIDAAIEKVKSNGSLAK